MIRSVLISLCAVSMAALPACGFKPIYAEASGVNADFGAMRVSTGEGRSAYLVRQSVIDTMGAERPGVAPRYDLALDIDERRRGFGIRINDVATRYELELSARYTLTSLDDTAAPPVRGSVKATASFDVSDDVYADIAVEENAKERAADLLADRLQRALAIHFSQA